MRQRASDGWGQRRWAVAIVAVWASQLWAAATAQTPWQTNAYGTLSTNIAWNYAMGYHFTPLVNGQVTALGGYFNGTRTVKLFNKVTGTVLATATVSAANTWAYTGIAPVNVTAGTTYTIAVYLAGSGASRRSGLSPTLPRTFADIRIEGSTYTATSTTPTAVPTNTITATMYGQADISFVPSDTTPPTGTVSINNNATYTNTTTVTLNLSATDNSGTVGQMQFSSDNVTYSTPEAYATTKAWTLATGDGTKPVYAKFKDAAGNWSTPVTDTIVLDRTSPAVQITSPADGTILTGP